MASAGRYSNASVPMHAEPARGAPEAGMPSRFRDLSLEERVAMVREDPALLSAVVGALDDDNDNVRYNAAAAVIRLSKIKR